MQVCVLLHMCARISCEFVLYRVYACVLMLKLHEFVLYSVYVCGSRIDNMAFVHVIL